MKHAYRPVWHDDPAWDCTYRVERDEDGDFEATCDEFPGLRVSDADGEKALERLVSEVSRRLRAQGVGHDWTKPGRGTLAAFADGEQVLDQLLARLSMLAYRAKRAGERDGYEYYTRRWHETTDERKAIKSYEFSRMRDAAALWHQRLLLLEPVAWPGKLQRDRIHADLEEHHDHTDRDWVSDRREIYACVEGCRPLEEHETWELWEDLRDAFLGLSAVYIALSYRGDPELQKSYGWWSAPDDPRHEERYRKLHMDLSREYHGMFGRHHENEEAERAALIPVIREWHMAYYDWDDKLHMLDQIHGDKWDQASDAER